MISYISSRFPYINLSHKQKALLWGALSLGTAPLRIPLPGTPVPLVLQPLFALIAGGLWGITGAAGQLIYLLGLPMVSHGTSYGKLLGPTGGYIYGIVLSSLLTAQLLKRKPGNFWKLFIQLEAILYGAIYLPGALHLSLFYYSTGVTAPHPVTLFFQSIAPFLYGDTLKVLAATRLIITLRK